MSESIAEMVLPGTYIEVRSEGLIAVGSIATGKYADVLSAVFGERLRFPAAFVGRGDMSRGGLLLRHVRSGVELEYRGLAGAPRTGARPPRLPREKS